MCGGGGFLTIKEWGEQLECLASRQDQRKLESGVLSRRGRLLEVDNSKVDSEYNAVCAQFPGFCVP